MSASPQHSPADQTAESRPRKRPRDSNGDERATSPTTASSTGHAERSTSPSSAPPSTRLPLSTSTHVQQHQPVKALPRAPLPITRETLEDSYFLVAPHDEFTREVGDWIWGWIQGRADVEIEAKVGILLDNRQGIPKGTRVNFPLATETILTDSTFSRFESNMSLKQHHHFNQILNLQASEAFQPSYTGAPIKYKHTREIDSFYPPPPSASSDGHSKTKVRVTRDEKTGQVKNENGRPASIEKTRIADMNIFSPKRGFDFRISVSVEKNVPLPNTKVAHQRWKNRVSYQHQACQIDLTQVRGGDSKEVLHELEVEISDMPLLYAEGQKAAAGQDSIYYELVQVFLNNIRMLIRNAVPP